MDEFLPAEYDTPRAALRIIEKDLQLATQLGRELRVPMRFANLALADVYEAMNRGWSERDCRSVMLLPQERAGVSIKVDKQLIEQVLQMRSTRTDRHQAGQGHLILLMVILSTIAPGTDSQLKGRTSCGEHGPALRYRAGR